MAAEDALVAGVAIGDDRIALSEALRSYATKHCGPDVVRRAVDHGQRGFGPHLEDAVELGWLGLHVAERNGGQGHGVAEAALVAEAFGRAVAPGPLLSTLAAGVLLGIASSGDHEPEIDDALAGLAGRAETAAIVTTGNRARPEREDPADDSFFFGPTVGADAADWLIVPTRHVPDGGERWCLVAAERATISSREPLDLTRGIATVRLEAAAVDGATVLAGIDRALVDATLATFAAAECAGVASWCVATAADYARQRRQFGRPIGQFQAVKHHCADMLVAAEAIRGVAWDAAQAADAFLDAESVAARRNEWILAAACAAAVALDATVWIAETCIQVLGGIGFTWEHDAHLYLRRAVALRQQLGGTVRWRRSVADAARCGVRRRLRVEVPDDARAADLRAEIRTNVEELATLDGPRQRARMVEMGYLVPHWPAPWGIGADATTQLLIDAELRRAKVRRPHLQVGAWAAPTIAAHGTPEQQQRWVRPTLLGTTTWCQLFSEPEAGSDLASLRTRATRVDGGWSVTGQKVWTTMAREAEWGICLVRTDPHAPKHAGITYLIIDMTTPGIEIRPLKEMTGLEMFNEVFFTDAFVPDDCVIGEVDGGWALARTTLGNERVSMGSGSSFGGGIENLLGLIDKRMDEMGDADAVVCDRLGALIGEAHAVATLGARMTLRSLSGAKPGPEASVRKLLGVEHDQRVQAFGLELLGPAGGAIDGDAATWTFGYLANRCLTIAGGTSEIQRNVIAERLLGLPRDVEPDVRGTS